MSHHVVRRLRPLLSTNFSRTLRCFSSDVNPKARQHATSHDYLQRIEHLEASSSRKEWYPRYAGVPNGPRRVLSQYNQDHGDLKNDETKQDLLFSVAGKIQSIRSAGGSLMFVTIEEDDQRLQIVLKHTLLPTQLKDFARIARKGDAYAFLGHPHRTTSGQLSLLATRAPTLLAPSLHQIPQQLTSAEKLSHHRHVHMLVDPKGRQLLKLRHTVERTIDQFLSNRQFIKVNTPILQAGAGGAVARPFETEATELQGRKLNLRVAPELWLKRLIVGGMPRVYEMGPVFRNEGVDATHNPEFTICEFYATYATVAALMHWTERLMYHLWEQTQTHKLAQLPVFTFPFAQLEFLPRLAAEMGCPLPDLEGPHARKQLMELCQANNIPLPQKPSLPRLLDALAARYIEPLCEQPTFIIHHPAVLSPLAKRFRCPQTQQLVSARAELFINQTEIANMYEEQNSPFEQREAFAEQLKHRAVDEEGDGKLDIDRAYIEALEWGMPPTGGWGCGVDRLVMLFAGKSRIGDVLSFGGLRNVVGVGKGKAKGKDK